MATQVTLPYFAPADTLPAPLPTVAEIMAVEQKLQTYGTGGVVRVGEHFVVKYGQNIHLQEGENMLFVAQSTSVPVPTVYALFHDELTDWNFIVQEYVPGVNLMTVWHKLDEPARDAIIIQLKRNMDELRSLPSPGYYGGIWGQVTREYYISGGGITKASTPKNIVKQMATDADWVDAMLAAANRIEPISEERFAYTYRMFHGTFCGLGDPVFTHGDLDRYNMMLRPDGTVVIFDWEYAGWYPPYWESGTTQLWRDKEDGFHRYVPRFLDEYPAQIGWLINFRMWVVWGGHQL
ncbi:kinase-like protein [Coniochaeta ligniaria NRRL 30616]|uniref:Kinase-like protein n=1 Tax=Coniochaeta ligniaria NRRL 30616 TaxID=1408157 RepID=A0A1J7JAG9_9PEZI|nr:kinase-like protein [Coniochaeta ligniaria NRRL 30616]